MMIGQSLMLSALVLAGITWASSVYAQDKDVERWKRSTWQIAMKLETPNLVPPAVQCTVLDKDPVPGFGARVKGMQAHYKKQLERADDEAKKGATPLITNDSRLGLGLQGGNRRSGQSTDIGT